MLPRVCRETAELLQSLTSGGSAEGKRPRERERAGKPRVGGTLLLAGGALAAG